MFHENIHLKRFVATALMCATLTTGTTARAAVNIKDTEHRATMPPLKQQEELPQQFSDRKEDVVLRLQEYLSDELHDAAYYEALAAMAPGEVERGIIEGFAKDEKRHAEQVAALLKKMTGKEISMPETDKPVMPTNYRDALLVRVKSETDDQLKYSREYMAAKKEPLKKFFFEASVDENIHAQRIQFLIDLTDLR